MATFSNLDPLDPSNNGPVSGGAEQIRDLKATLKDQFPGGSPGDVPTPDGLDKPVLASAEEMNTLVGLDTASTLDEKFVFLGASIQQYLGAPAGTQMVFYQAAPPNGWTITTDVNDSMLRIVTSFGGGSGGNSSPVSLALSHQHTTGDHQLTIPEMPAHNHKIGVSVQGGTSGSIVSAQQGTNASTTTVGNGEAHNHGVTGLKLSTWTPRYVNMIKASKDVYVP